MPLRPKIGECRPSALARSSPPDAGRSTHTDPPFISVCLKKDLAVFAEYAGRHPELLNEDFFVVAIEALQEVFPCPG